jgi:hypothetical protein
VLISQGRTSALGRKPWAGIELVSEARTEENVLHIVQWAGKALAGQPFQLLFPVKSRDLPGVKMLSPYLFARAANLASLKSVSSIYGIQGLVTGPDNKILALDDDFVQNVVRKTREAAEGWSKGIKKGSFVRILLGSEHMLAGHVRKLTAGIAEVQIEMKLRTVKLTIPVKALLNLDHVPKGKREYFYVDSL